MIWSLNNSTRLKCPSIRFPLILLLIVAKAQVREDGLCYIGWDMDRHKLVRPVLRIRSFRWLRKDPKLHIGEQHLFKIKSLYLEGTPYPHRMDDVLVDYDEPYEQAADNSDVVELYDILIRLSHQTVKKVFDDMDPLHGKYFLEHTKCPSVGIYKCKRESITTEREERRCKITEDGLIVYNYKITAVNNELPDIDINEDVLVILGLARPSRGRYYQYDKSRCQIMVVGFIATCTNTQQHSRFESQLKQSDRSSDRNRNGISSHVKVLSPQPLATGRKRKLETNYVRH